MVAGDTQADLAIDLEAASCSEEAKRRWLEGVSRWENDAAVVDSAFEGGGSGWAAQSKVPFEQI